jgi:hypothetical protein
MAIDLKKMPRKLLRSGHGHYIHFPESVFEIMGWDADGLFDVEIVKKGRKVAFTLSQDGANAKKRN